MDKIIFQGFDDLKDFLNLFTRWIVSLSEMEELNSLTQSKKILNDSDLILLLKIFGDSKKRKKLNNKRKELFYENT